MKSSSADRKLVTSCQCRKAEKAWFEVKSGWDLLVSVYRSTSIYLDVHLEPVECFYLSYIYHMTVIWQVHSYVCHISSIWHEFIFQQNSCCYPFEWMYSIQPSFQYTQWVFTFVVIIFSRVIPCLSQHGYMTRINKVYDRHMPRFLCSSMNCVFTEEITTKLSRLVWTNMYLCITRRGTSHKPLKSMFYCTVMYDRYMSSICMAYIFSRCWSRCWTFPLQHGCVIPCE